MVQSCLSQGPGSPVMFNGMVAASPILRRILDEARRAAASDIGVLLTGETGTGKDLLARAIHRASRRCEAPFVTVDCSALPQEILGSELFGHSPGAFSGAGRERIGRFEAARGGTLFLDRIDDLDPRAQAQILRVLEEREVIPLGETRPRPVDFRLLASSGPDLREKLAGGLFRRDLFYRVNVLEIEIPPLRMRAEDIPFLADHFLKDFARRFGKPLRGISQRALGLLKAYDWPGNVRELGSVLEAAGGSARGEEIQESDLPVGLRIPRARERDAPEIPMAPHGAGGPAILSFSERVEEFQRTLLLKTLGKNLWNHREAARELGLERHQLKYLCAKLGIRRSLA